MIAMRGPISFGGFITRLRFEAIKKRYSVSAIANLLLDYLPLY
jgi:hypothetical protein